ncbi:MAG: hypothetical protein ABEJ74_07880 [Haloferacaceae archaeon]
MPTMQRPLVDRPAIRGAVSGVLTVVLFLLLAGVLGYGHLATTPVGFVLVMALAFVAARVGRGLGSDES